MLSSKTMHPLVVKNLLWSGFEEEICFGILTGCPDCLSKCQLYPGCGWQEMYRPPPFTQGLSFSSFFPNSDYSAFWDFKIIPRCGCVNEKPIIYYNSNTNLITKVFMLIYMSESTWLYILLLPCFTGLS